MRLLGAVLAGVAALPVLAGTMPASAVSSASVTTTSAGTAASGDWWHPKAGMSWQWQLSGKIDTSVKAEVFDIDMFDATASTVSTLHGMGRKVVCYIDIGAAEQGRPDFKDFPKSALGNKVDGWPQERWVDIRQIDVIKRIWSARLDQCKAKGFDGVEADLVDAYQQESGFPVTAKHQLAFNRMLAQGAHQHGLAIGLKNDLDQIPQLVGDFDFAVNEQCAEYKECSSLTPFIKAGKPVFHAEYTVALSKFCPESKRLGLSSIKKTLDLTAKRETCPA